MTTKIKQWVIADGAVGAAQLADDAVTAGDSFSLVVSQTSGAARNTLGASGSMWFCVEAVS